MNVVATRWSLKAVVLVLGLSVSALIVSPGTVHAQTLVSPYDTNYTLFDLGSVAGVPASYGGLAFLAGDSNTLLIGGDANDPLGAIYSIAVVRDSGGHITGFSGTASMFADAPNNDGGLAYGPGGVLFYTRYSDNEIGQIKPGSSTTDRVIDLTPLGVNSSVGGLVFVPAGFPGAGQLKIASYSSDDWYSAGVTSDGTGTYNIVSVTLETTLPGVGPEGFVYVPSGSPDFPPNSLLLSEYGSDVVATYEVDANGDPINATRAEFVTDLTGAEGAVIDPLTGDFLFSTYGGGDRVIRVEGFLPPPAEPTPTSEPTATLTDTPVPATPTATPAAPTPTSEPGATAAATPMPATPTATEAAAIPTPALTPTAAVLPVALPATGAGAPGETNVLWMIALAGVAAAALATVFVALIRRRGPV